jgi:outer membrane immunogenic protein
VNNAGTFTNHPSAVIAGIQAGQDWAWKQLVYGVALDYSAMPFGSSQNVSNATYPSSSDQYSVSTSMSVDWLFTLRGRVGYATTLHEWPSLFYVTGGPALTQVKVNNSFSDNSSYEGAGGNSTSAYQVGWTAGAGVELLSFKNVSVDVEYSYVRMPSVETTSNISNAQGGFGIPAQSLNNPFTTTGKFSANTLKIGLKYRF